MSRISKRNDEYLKRVERSMQAERRHREERRVAQEARHQGREARRQEHKAAHEARDCEIQERVDKIRAQNEAYGAFWVDSCGSEAMRLVAALQSGSEPSLAQKALRIRAYKPRQGVSDVSASEVVGALLDAVDMVDDPTRAQARVGEHSIAAPIAHFLRDQIP